MSSDIKDQLRRANKTKRDNMLANGIGHPHVVLMEQEALDRITKLEAEVAALKQEKETMHQNMLTVVAAGVGVKQQLEEAEAQLAALRKDAKFVYDDLKMRAGDGVVPISHSAWEKVCHMVALIQESE